MSCEGSRFRGDGAGGREDDASLHRIFQLADVARPLVVHQDAEGFRGEAGGFGAVFRGVELEEVLSEQGDVFAALTERRKLQHDDVEAVEEVFAEAAVFDGLLEVDIGGGDDADVDLDLTGAAEVHEAAVLQDTEDLGLHVHGHGTDLV